VRALSTEHTYQAGQPISNSPQRSLPQPSNTAIQHSYCCGSRWWGLLRAQSRTSLSSVNGVPRAIPRPPRFTHSSLVACVCLGHSRPAVPEPSKARRKERTGAGSPRGSPRESLVQPDDGSLAAVVAKAAAPTNSPPKALAHPWARMPWYFGKGSAQEASKALKGTSEGTYLLRESKSRPGEYVPPPPPHTHTQMHTRMRTRTRTRTRTPSHLLPVHHFCHQYSIKRTNGPT
jgi:hypothetical protein